MKDELVTFETAQLAKEKGFIHMKANCYGDNMCYQLPDGELTNALKGNTVSGYILAPTQSLLQKWLRDTHKIDVFIEEGYHYTIHTIYTYEKSEGFNSGIGHNNTGISNGEFETYEEALEIGLVEALKQIKK
jgi:hypothetical protein